MNKQSHLLHMLLVIILTLSMITGCKEKDDNKPYAGAVPTITLSPSEMSIAPGSNANSTVLIDAPEGLKKLVIYKNGISFQELPFNYEKSVTHSFNYTVESNAAAGSTISFSFEAIDSLDRKSDQKNFIISVTEKPQKEILQVIADITTNTTWTADKIWRINNIVRVKEGSILTIEPGTLVFGASDTKGTLIVQRGAKIIAEGTSSSPIVFTSDKVPGSRAAGDWGGIVICGKAPNNQGNNNSIEGMTGEYYGGNVANDNSGVLKYVRIEFAGKRIETNKEINSLTLASVGSETTIAFIQASFGLDDSFELFGGTVNAKNLISYRTEDDDFDVDYGHVGYIQFALGIRDANIADQFYSNGLEVDNNGAGTSQTPYTQTVFSNITIIGGKYTAENPVHLSLQNAAQLRTNSMPAIYNSFFTGFPFGLLIDDTKPGASQHALNEELQVRNVILAGVENWGNNGWGGNTNNTNGPVVHAGTGASGFNVDTWFQSNLYNNSIKSKWQDAGIDESLYVTMNPKVTPNQGSILLSAAKWDNTPKASSSFFEKVTFTGAFGSNDWSAGWCNWNPQETVYQ
ncbi:MAG: Ig-like domain repeat protein [Chloroflexota bacterium]|nr:hypothetical protein [Lentimicrobium sp.]